MATHCLFDMDGLLLDMERIYTEVNVEILARYGKTLTWDTKAKMMGAKEQDIADLVVHHYQLPLASDEYIKERREKLAARFPFAQVLPGVVRMIQHLFENGVPIAVATSSRRKAFEIKSSRNQEFFRLFGGDIICGDDIHIRNGKPAPDIFLATANCLGLNATVGTNNRNCLVFEDSVLGAWSGIRANMSVILIPDPNLEIEPELSRRCAKVLTSMEDFDPAEFGLPAFPL
ncbi:UNVERIFIED_CONTAM: Pseudouridine-5'-phosphatase [Siphonaria sp. JEL0065]|nr:Pseudouridine-5'-phosphatase [Siphonaria sp. JEL0065]